MAKELSFTLSGTTFSAAPVKRWKGNFLIFAENYFSVRHTIDYRE